MIELKTADRINAAHAAVEAAAAGALQHARQCGEPADPQPREQDRAEHAQGLFWDALRELSPTDRRALLLLAIEEEFDR